MANQYDDLPEGAEVVQYDDLPEGASLEGAPTVAQPYVPKKQMGPPQVSFRQGTLEGAPDWAMEPPRDPYTPQERAAAAQGVNIDNPAPVSFAKGSLAISPEKKQEYYDKILTKAGFNTRPGKAGLEWQDATGKWNLVEPSDSASSLGGLLVGGTSAVGGILGTMVPMPGVGSIAGSGIGAGLGASVKAALANHYGVNDGVSGKDIALDVGKEAALASTIQSVFHGATVGAPRFARWFFKGEAPLNPAVAGRVLSDADTYGAQIDQFNAQLGDKDPKLALSAAQAAYAQEQTPEAAQALGKQLGLDVSPTVSERTVARVQGNENSFLAFFRRTLTDPFSSDQSQEALGGTVQKVSQALADGDATPLIKAAGDAAAEAQQQAGALKQPWTPAKSGQVIRETLAKQYDEATSKVNQAYDQYRSLAGYTADGTKSKYQLTVTPKIVDLMSKFKAQIDNSLLEEEKATAKKYLIDVQDSVKPPSLFNEWNSFGSRSPAQLDLAQVDRAIKFLNAQDFNARAGDTALRLAGADRAQLLSALKDVRTTFLSQDTPEISALRDSLQTADGLYKERSVTFEREMVGNILTKDDSGQYKLSNQKVARQILLNKDEQVAGDFAKLINQDPSAHAELAKFLQGFYSRYGMSMGKDGLRELNPRIHAKFMENYGGVLKEMLSPQEFTQFTKLGGAIDVAQSAQAAVDLQNQAFSRSLGKVTRMGPEQVISSFFTKSLDASKMRPFVMATRSQMGDQALDGWRKGIVQQLKSEAIDKDGKLDINVLDRMVSDPVQKEKFELLFGKGYVENLNLLKNSVTAARASVKAISPPAKNTVLRNVLRPVFGPLSTEGRFQTSMIDFRVKAYMKDLETAMYNKEDLEDLAKRASKDLLRSQTAGAVGAIGTGTVLKERDEY